MTVKPSYGLILGLILVLCVLLAGCSSQSSTTTIAKVTTPPAAKYTAGDIITNNASSSFWLITAYDSTNNLYTRVLVAKNSGGTWSQITGVTQQDTQKDVEKLYQVRVTQVSVASVTYATPTVPTTVQTTLSGSGPIISNVSPTTGSIGGSLSITVGGNNFQNGATLRLVQPGVQPVTATGVSVTSTQITGTFDLSNLNAGPANIQVINPDGRFTSLNSAVTIGQPSPVLNNINPSSGTQGSTYTLTVTGQYFTDVTLVNLVQGSGTPIQCPVTSPSATQASCSLKIPSTAAFGSYNVEIMTSDGMIGWSNSSFTVNNATSS